MSWLGAPDQGVDQGPARPLGRAGGDQPNTNPTLIKSALHLDVLFLRFGSLYYSYGREHGGS